MNKIWVCDQDCTMAPVIGKDKMGVSPKLEPDGGEQNIFFKYQWRSAPTHTNVVPVIVITVLPAVGPVTGERDAIAGGLK